ncbi:hypothetical protein EB796_008112 [Bugula neritina]|uniref:Uncharacterized protein n=1 Tax=Bugula neritina TaxID=10212 RepID=A0A7J7K4L5_BUGNE|nr:hypothetical protein EB796_008112 [Bugula neritina]
MSHKLNKSMDANIFNCITVFLSEYFYQIIFSMILGLKLKGNNAYTLGFNRRHYYKSRVTLISIFQSQL